MTGDSHRPPWSGCARSVATAADLRSSERPAAIRDHSTCGGREVVPVDRREPRGTGRRPSRTAAASPRESPPTAPGGRIPSCRASRSCSPSPRTRGRWSSTSRTRGRRRAGSRTFIPKWRPARATSRTTPWARSTTASPDLEGVDERYLAGGGDHRRRRVDLDPRQPPAHRKLIGGRPAVPPPRRTLTVECRAPQCSQAGRCVGQGWLHLDTSGGLLGHVDEAAEVALEGHGDGGGWAVAVLGDDEVGLAGAW